MFNIKEINNNHDCGECIFCLSKCPKCGTVDVEVKYHRKYFKDGSITSAAYVGCKECDRTIIKSHELPLSIGCDEYGNPVKIEECYQEYNLVSKLTELIDVHFEDYVPEIPSDVEIIYEIINETEDVIKLNCEDIIGDANHLSLPSSINFKIGEKNGKHQKIAVTETFCERVHDNA